MTRVIKVGGRVQNDPALAGAIADVMAGSRDGLVVVHGGGDEVSTMQRQLGLEPRFVGGRRVTTPDELEIVRMVLSGTANKRLVAQCRRAGVRAVGISGEDGGLLMAHVAEGAPLGRVAARVSADAAILRDLLAAGWTPIVSPLGCDADDEAGGGVNVNGDDAAAAIAVALRAAELVFVADVAGVIVDGVVAATLSRTEAASLIERGVAKGGMAAKLEAGAVAAGLGVARVRISDLSALGDPARGTTLLPSRVMAPWEQ